MYNLTLTEEELRTHVTGLDSYIRVIASQLAQAQSPGVVLKQALNQLVDIDKQFDKLQGMISKEKTNG